MKRFKHYGSWSAAGALCACLFWPTTGCRPTHAAPAIPRTGVAASALASVPPKKIVGALPPNEVGVIPVLEYHAIATKERFMRRSVDRFRSDLQRLYDENYRPISIHDYLDNRIAIPAGTSPVILTFDDSWKSQFCYRPDGGIDPDCAVGILQAFHTAHPDFPLKATFFILPKSAFGQPKLAAKKVQALVDMGFEIGNHTVTHRLLRRLSDSEVQKEIATCDRLLKQYAPNARIETLAFPGGRTPHNVRLIFHGSYRGYVYNYRAGFLASSDPAPSPVAARQDRHRIQRVLADENKLGITYWLDILKTHPKKRYVSDGDPMTVSVPKASAALVNRRLLNGATLRLF